MHRKGSLRVCVFPAAAPCPPPTPRPPPPQDVRVPLFIRGPGIPAGRVSDYQATMVDLPATVAQLGGGAGGWGLVAGSLGQWEQGQGLDVAVRE